MNPYDDGRQRRDDYNTQRIVESNLALRNELRRQEEIQRNREHNAWLQSDEGQFRVAWDLQLDLVSRMRDPVGAAKAETLAAGFRVIGIGIVIEVVAWILALSHGLAALTPVAWVIFLIAVLGPIAAIILFYIWSKERRARGESEKRDLEAPHQQRLLAMLESAVNAGRISQEISADQVAARTSKLMKYPT